MPKKTAPTRPSKPVALRVTGPIEPHLSGIPRIQVPRDVVLALRRDKGPIRVIAALNGYVFHAAVMPQPEGGFIMMTGKVRTGGRVEVGEVVTLELTPDESEIGLPVPAELEEALVIDRVGARVFAGLTPGRQRGIIALVDRQKGPDARANKALAVLDGLKCGVTDLKELARHKVAGRTLE